MSLGGGCNKRTAQRLEFADVNNDVDGRAAGFCIGGRRDDTLHGCIYSGKEM